MRKGLLIAGAIMLVAILIVSCGGDDGPTASENQAPGQPTLSSPANDATGISVTSVLSWTGSDPDGDDLTYTIHFGTTSPAPTVDEGSATSYSPSSLAYSTKYYWFITAKDPDGATTNSDEWNFTTIAEPVESITAPSAPSGPTTGYVAQSLNYDASGSVSNLGHALEYRFEDGDGNYSSWSTTAATLQWYTAGTYDVTAQARCIEHPTVISAWSPATTVTITEFALETVSTPDIPNGPTTGVTDQSLTYSGSGATSSLGHDVQYRYDWGEGTISGWYNLGYSASHSWSEAGSYEVKTQARCYTHTTVESNWSAAKTVTITLAAGETVSPPDAPTGPATGTVGEAVAITNQGGAVSSDGHSLEYRFDFGDGEMSTWYYNWTSYGYTYDTAGTYEVKMQARCATHTTIESDWSEALSIVVSNPPEALAYNTGLVYGDVIEGQINESYEYSVAHSSTTNWGDPMEGQFDWGDGTTSDWSSTQAQSHTWTTEGTYGVSYTGRCTVHNDFVIYSDTLIVTITTEAVETITTPGYINWQDAQDHPMLDVETMYYAYGGTSSLGHDTEDRISWGDGDTTGWVAAGTQILKTWTELGTFSLTRQTRCIAHPDVISEWSNPSNIITGPETVSAPDAPPGPAYATRNTVVYFLGTGAESSWHSYSWLSYRFAWGDGDTTEWRERLDTLVGHVYSVVGEYEVTAQAKCIWPGHGEPVSEWSLPSVIDILESISFNENVTGPIDGPIDRSITFEQTFEAVSSEGHAMEYRFSFGDGDTSLWAAELTASHTYSTAGAYYVMCQARCAEHTLAMTEWPTLNLHRIEITDGPEVVSIPSVTVGLETTIGDSTYIRVGRSTSNYGDSLEYQIDFGDGTFSEWFPTTWNSSRYWEMVPEYIHYTYAAVGSYGVRGRARCQLHPTVISEWSTVTVRQTAVILEIISTPGTPTGLATGTVGENMTFTTTGATSSEGHALEYMFYYLRGTYLEGASDWSTSLTHTYVFTSANTYKVRIWARCIEHPDADAWSEDLIITITD